MYSATLQNTLLSGRCSSGMAKFASVWLGTSWGYVCRPRGFRWVAYPERQALTAQSLAFFLSICHHSLRFSIFMYLRCIKKSRKCLDPTQVQASLLLLMFWYLIIYQEGRFLLRESDAFLLCLVFVAHFPEIQTELLCPNQAFDLRNDISPAGLIGMVRDREFRDIYWAIWPWNLFTYN